MKILQINKYFYHKGGAETVFFNTMHLLEQYGHSVIPFSLKSELNQPSPYASYFVDYPELSEAGFWTKLRHVPSFVYNREAARQLDRLLEREKPDLAHIHLMFNSFSASILPVLKRHGVPVVMSIHDHRLICPAYSFTDGKGQVCERCLKGRSYWHCVSKRCSHGNLPNSLLLAADSYFRKYILSPEDYIERFIFVAAFAQAKHSRVSQKIRDKSTVLFNFTPLEKARAEKEDYLLYFGRISEEKGLPVLMKAMENLPEVKLKIVGTGPLLEALRQQATPNVEFLGFKSGEELEGYIKKARFIILPSVCYENGPMVVVEAYTLGTPAIGSRIGGIPEYILDRQSGFLFEPGSAASLQAAIGQALSLTEPAYGAMCKEAEAFAEAHFTEAAYYKKLFALYEDVIHKQK
ncbi:MAG: glycosyltransferase [Tannerellaceae bacterium]|jgi:glycosyltransferase involved in cell wall biosynthesis|nr:glycosyltransferase [Tannerellaceae bacterium]